MDTLAPNFRAAAECASESADAHNGSLEPAEEPQTSSHSPSRHADHPGPGADGDAAEPGDTRDSRDSKLLLPKEVSGKPREPLSFLLDMMHHHKEGPGKPKLKQAGRAGGSGEPLRKPAEAPPRPRPQPPAEPKARVLELSPLAEQKREERKAGGRRLNHVKEDRCTPGPTEPTEPTVQAQQVQNGKPVPADSPQPRGRSKKGKKKKGERAHSSIGNRQAAGRGAGGGNGGMGGEGRGSAHSSISNERAGGMGGEGRGGAWEWAEVGLGVGRAHPRPSSSRWCPECCQSQLRAVLMGPFTSKGGQITVVAVFCSFEILLDFPKNCTKSTESPCTLGFPPPHPFPALSLCCFSEPDERGCSHDALCPGVQQCAPAQNEVLPQSSAVTGVGEGTTLPLSDNRPSVFSRGRGPVLLRRLTRRPV